ncbi:MAG: WecB/TagA/CpsF family glycosyltransferase [Lachnospiraceae bacterium]|nr:WecB/TagA/CpsF family glycosyltransferase [Lachnospiraceae bacterium]
MAELQYCEILKTNINVTNMQDTLDYINRHIDVLRGRYICVSNVHTTVMSYENRKYRAIQNRAAMALPDGAPLSKYSRFIGFKKAGRVTGPDLMVEIFRISPQKGYRHFFYGATQQTLEDMKTTLQKDYPGIVIAGMYAPPFRTLTEEEDKEIIALINNARPDFIWVGLGAPKQEQWMYHHRGKLNAVSIGVGAGFDYLAGNIKRAPRIMQVFCLEWLYRLMQDPGRLWKRYVTTNTKFIRYILRERLKNRAKKG